MYYQIIASFVFLFFWWIFFKMLEYFCDQNQDQGQNTQK